MSYQEKKTIVSIITGLLVLVAYYIYVRGNYQIGMNTTEDMKFWATTMLLFIGIGIVVAIVIQIIFHILLSVAIAVQKKVENGQCDDGEIERILGTEMVTDEMDKLIELKSMRVGFIVAGIGFVAALISLLLNNSPGVMMNILFISFSAGSLFEGFTQLYFYRRGVTNG